MVKVKIIAKENPLTEDVDISIEPFCKYGTKKEQEVAKQILSKLTAVYGELVEELYGKKEED